MRASAAAARKQELAAAGGIPPQRVAPQAVNP